MEDISKRLGTYVRDSREAMGLTQLEVSNALGVDTRTILNIENGRGNPKLCILYPLIRFLKINTEELFCPELEQHTPSHAKLQMIAADLSEEEIDALLPVLNASIQLLRQRVPSEMI